MQFFTAAHSPVGMTPVQPAEGGITNPLIGLAAKLKRYRHEACWYRAGGDPAGRLDHFTGA